jgi:hypothetical protein
MFTNFKGTVTIGGLPAADGVAIYAKIDWYVSRPVKTYAGEYISLTVAPNDWALDLKDVTFHIGDYSQADETGWYNGKTFGSSTVNLTFPAVDNP